MPATARGKGKGRGVAREEAEQHRREAFQRVYDGEDSWGYFYPDHATTYSLVPAPGGKLQMVAGRVAGAVAEVLVSPMASGDVFREEVMESLIPAILPPKRPRGCDRLSLVRHVGRAIQQWHEDGNSGLPPAAWFSVPGFTHAEVVCELAALADIEARLFQPC